MPKITRIFSSVLLASSLCFSLSAHADNENNQFILLGNDVALKGVSNDLSDKGGQVIRKMNFTSGVVANIPTQALNGLKNKFPDIQFIKDIEVKLVKKPADKPGGGGDKGDDTTNQPAQQAPWGLLAIGADLTHSTTKGAGVTVCVIDTGIDHDHPDLVNNVIGGENFIVSKGRLDPTKFYDDNGHGTHVAGTIAAEDNDIGSIGVAPEANLFGVKVLDRRGSGSLSGVVDGINSCIKNNADVINMSLGATVSPTSDSGLLMQAAVDAANSAGIDVIVAAGNEGQDISNVIPAGLNNVTAVSAVDQNMNFPSWSNFGLSLGDYAAPGVGIYSTWKNGEYNTISGTSMASPHVAGVSALKKAAGKADLKASDIGASTSRQGSGLIDALATILGL